MSPEEGYRSVPVPEGETKWGTIAGDLEALVGGDDVSGAVFLFHAPPHRSALDRAALDGQVGGPRARSTSTSAASPSAASSRRASRSLTLHGHVHESARLTGAWQDRIGRTVCLSAAHDGPELALVRFDLESPAGASRELVVGCSIRGGW